MHFYGDLIFPDVDPYVLAEKWTSGALAEGLSMLADIARASGFGEVWEDAKPIGLSTSYYEGGPPRWFEAGRFGVSLAHAPLAGIGFERDDAYVAEVPVPQPDMTPFQLTVLRRFEGHHRYQASVRGPQVRAVRALAEAARGRLPFPVAPAIGFESSWVHDFRASYLRRLAFALGSEASLRAGSLAPYEAHYPLLVAGSVAEVRAAVPPPDDPLSFSLRLNLIGVIDAIAAHERAHEGPAPTLEGRLVEGPAKREALAEDLEAAAEVRARPLHEEGKLVVRALLDQSRRLETKSTWFHGYPQDWSEARVPDPGRSYGDE